MAEFDAVPVALVPQVQGPVEHLRAHQKRKECVECRIVLRDVVKFQSFQRLIINKKKDALPFYCICLGTKWHVYVSIVKDEATKFTRVRL